MRSYNGSKEAIGDYFQGVDDFQRRGERYLTSDNIHNHATEIIRLTHEIEAMHPNDLKAIDKKIARDNPGIEEDAQGIAPHVFITERIRDIVRSTRRTKHEELSQAVGQFTSRFTNLIMRIMPSHLDCRRKPLLTRGTRQNVETPRNPNICPSAIYVAVPTPPPRPPGLAGEMVDSRRSPRVNHAKARRDYAVKKRQPAEDEAEQDAPASATPTSSSPSCGFAITLCSRLC
jgi:hypothetical protein